MGAQLGRWQDYSSKAYGCIVSIMWIMFSIPNTVLTHSFFYMTHFSYDIRIGNTGCYVKSAVAMSPPMQDMYAFLRMFREVSIDGQWHFDDATGINRILKKLWDLCSTVTQYWESCVASMTEIVSIVYSLSLDASRVHNGGCQAVAELNIPWVDSFETRDWVSIASLPSPPASAPPM